MNSKLQKITQNKLGKQMPKNKRNWYHVRQKPWALADRKACSLLFLSIRKGGCKQKPILDPYMNIKNIEVSALGNLMEQNMKQRNIKFNRFAIKVKTKQCPFFWFVFHMAQNCKLDHLAQDWIGNTFIYNIKNCDIRRGILKETV